MRLRIAGVQACLMLAALLGADIAHGSDQEPGAGRCVVLLHGLARTSRSMRPVGDALANAGWSVVNAGYPSRSASVEALSQHAGDAIARCRERVASADVVDVVTHSMGGILLRHWVSQTRDTLGRVVMLAPPNQGSELVDRLSKMPAFRLYNGPAGQQLGTDDQAIWRRLPEVTFELGVVAGTGEERGFLGRHVASPNDGKVSVASTRVEGMADHLVVPLGHTFIMNDAEVHRQIKQFLLHGRFLCPSRHLERESAIHFGERCR